MNKIFAAIFFLLFSCGTIYSQEKLSLDQAISLALKNNFDIATARNDSAIAALNNSAGNAGMLPKANLSVGDNYSLNNVYQQLNTGGEIKKNNAGSNNINAAIGFNWTLFDGMKMFATREKLGVLEEQSGINLKNKIQSSIAAVIISYYSIVMQYQQIKAQLETNKISEERVKIGTLRFENGSTSKVEMLQAKVDLNAGKATLLQLNVILEQKKNALNLLLNRELETNFDVSDSIPLVYKPNMKDLLAKLPKNNFSIQQSENNVKISQLTKKEITSQRLPTVGFSAAYNYLYTKNDAGLTLLNNTFGPAVGANISIPLFNGFNINRQIQTASIDILSKQNDLEKVKLQASYDLLKAYKNYTLYSEALKLEEENIILAKENADISMARFKLSQATSLEVITAQNSLMTAYNRLLTARYNAKQAEIELMVLNGELVK